MTDREKIKTGMRLITYAAALVLILVFFKDILHGFGWFFGLFTSFFTGIVVAFILDKPYELFRRIYGQKIKMKDNAARGLSILTVYVILIVVLASVIGVVLPQLISNVELFAASLKDNIGNIQASLNEITAQLNMDPVDLTDVMNFITGYFSNFDGIMNDILPHVANVTMGMATAVANLFIALVFSIYLLAGKEKLIWQAKRILKAFVPEKICRKFRYAGNIIIETFQNYIAGQSLEAVILGGLCFIGMVILRLEYAGMVSIVVGITAMIPILGAYIGGALAVVLLLLVSPIKALVFLIFFVILQQCENNLIYPRVVGGKIGLPGIWVLLGITVGGKVGGVLGMLFGVPVTTVVYTLLKNSVRDRENRNSRRN